MTGLGRGFFMETNENRYPIDFDTVEKGTRFTPQFLSDALGVSMEAKGFPLAILGFVERLRNELEDRNKPATVAVVKGMVCVLTDQEASVYNPAEFERGLKKAKRAHRRTLQIDVGQLDENNKLRHERNIVTQAAILAAVREAKNTTVIAYKRSVPGIESK